MVEPKVKGFPVINARAMIEDKLGDGWFTKVARVHDPSWPERVVPGDWYSVWTYNHVLEQAHDALGTHGSVQDLVTELARETANEDLNGLLRAFLWVATPHMFLRTATRIWDTYANFTHIGQIQNDEGRFAMRVTEIPAGLEDWVAGCWRGSLPMALELVGAEEVEAEITEFGPSEDADTWELGLRVTYS